MSARYPVPAARHRAEQSIERSRFICTLQRVATAADAQAFIKEMNAEFADASHNCWAYVAGPPGDTNQVGMSDDGEPHGTAGRPMLTVLLHGGVGEIVAVVTRYFGGTRLGTGGLVKAYGGAVQHALESMPRAERVELADVAVVVGYGSVTVAQQLFGELEARVLAQDYGTEVRFELRLPREHLERLRARLADLTRGDARVVVNGEDRA